MRRPSCPAIVRLFPLILLVLPATASAVDPALQLRVEAGGSAGLRSAISDHGLGVHFGGRVTYRVSPPVALGLRIGGSFFPPAGTDSDFAHAAYELGITGNLAKGLWADAYLGYHTMNDQGGFGFDLSVGYDLAVGTVAGIGPFVGYSLALLDETEHFLQFGIGATFGLPGPGPAASSRGRISSTDDDQDGMVGDADQCADEAEDVDNHEDTDGCPDPDNDADRILDSNDECPNEAEDIDEHEDENGCPDLDDDQDQVPDASDRCRNEPEDRDSFQDEDGCPDPDNDGDTVLDATDRCAGEAEDRDSFQDEDGCPDPDNDGDGKADSGDACPGEPQTGTSTDGCPQRVRVDQGGAVRLLEAIRFRGAALDRASNGVLDDLAAILKSPSAPAQVTIQVFVPATGAAPAQATSSQRRADAVKAALVSRQVPADRIEATGMGGDANERVEVHFRR